MTKPYRCPDCKAFVGHVGRCKVCIRERKIAYNRKYNKEMKLNSERFRDRGECLIKPPNNTGCQRPKGHEGMHRAYLMWTDKDAQDG